MFLSEGVIVVHAEGTDRDLVFSGFWWVGLKGATRKLIFVFFSIIFLHLEANPARGYGIVAAPREPWAAFFAFWESPPLLPQKNKGGSCKRHF